MPIQEQNIVFVESQVMGDVPEGGGAATGNVIVDGEMNNMFEDISDLDLTLGRFNLRKFFLAVRTLSTELYGGAKSVITALPEDDALGYTLFSTGDPFDRRSSAIDRVEAYFYKGPMWHGVLQENHIAGMQAINILQRVGTDLPAIGKTLALVQNEGQSNEIEQYVRVTDVDATEVTFTDSKGDYTRLAVTLSLSDALQHNFTGHQANRNDDYDYGVGARLRNTNVADATNYYGSQRLTESASVGDLQVRAASQFTDLVPSARSETPLVNQPLNPSLIQTINAGARDVEVPQQAHTLAAEVTAENRRINWVQTLLPRPAAATLTVAYMAQGNWYVLSDDGTGVLSGSDPSAGAGTVSYQSGVTSVSLGALPDAGSQILYTWASPVHYTVRAGGTAINDSYVSVLFQLTDLPALPETLTLGWAANGQAKTATVDTAGQISGDGNGQVDPVTGEGELRLTTLPDRGSPLTIDYDWLDGEPGEETLLTETLAMATTMTLDQPAVAGTVRFKLLLGSSVYVNAESTAAGDLVVPPQALRRRDNGERYWTWRLASEVVIGSVNHAARSISITQSQIQFDGQLYTLDGSGWVPSTKTLGLATGENTEVTYRNDAITPITKTAQQTPAIDALRLRLMPLSDFVVPDSVRFELGGLVYDDASGTLFTGQDLLDSGSMDYDVGNATITYWNDGVAAAPDVTSLLARYGDWLAVEASFRSQLSPLAPESVQVLAVTEDGEQITGTSDANGDIIGAKMRGAVNYQFGTGAVEFGEMGEDPQNPSGPDIWLPIAIDPASIKYNAVSWRYIPLPADILGINAVRLPPDGRVPIYRAGDVVMVMHAADTAPTTPAQQGGTGPYIVDCGRARLAWVRVIDNNGDTVTEGFELDRANGLVTWDDIGALATPVVVRHTVADLRLLTDAQISGQLALSRPLSHDFPANESIVGSCLLHGDRRARVSQTWDQHSWDSTWVDHQVGPDATASLDLIAHPVEVTNEGAETERWVLRWTSTTNVELIGETRGLVYSGPFNADIAPINPRTRESGGGGGVPYLHIPVAANGGGWSAGNVVRINTVGAIEPIWIARSIQQSDQPAGDGVDGVEMYALGNIDNPGV